MVFIHVLAVGKFSRPYRVSSVIWCPLLQSNIVLSRIDIRIVEDQGWEVELIIIHH
jgi:hypothetical protein